MLNHICGHGTIGRLVKLINVFFMLINQLIDLNKYKTAPKLDLVQIQKLAKELDEQIGSSDWLTIGVMAKSDCEAKSALRTFINKYSYIKFTDFEKLKAVGSVFLKGNQKTGEVYIRSEYGLGEGILLTCQYNDLSQNSVTYGPLPLNFFATKNY